MNRLDLGSSSRARSSCVFAGVATNTVSNLEAGRNVGFESIVRVAMVLGRGKDLEGLFLPRLESLEDIRRYENSLQRRRSRRKSD